MSKFLILYFFSFLCSSRTIVVDFGYRLTVINMNETPVSIGQMHSFYLYMYNGEYYDRPGTIPHLYSKTGVYTGI